MSELEMKLQEEFDRYILEISSKSLVKLRHKCIKDGLVVGRLLPFGQHMTAFQVKLKENEPCH